MARYALVAPDDSIYTEKDETRIDFTAGVRDGYRWLRIDNILDDQTTQAEWTIREPMVQTIFADRIERVTVHRNMTTPEINAKKSQLSGDLVDQIQWKAIFLTINEARDANNKQPLSAAQFRSWIEGQM